MNRTVISLFSLLSPVLLTLSAAAGGQRPNVLFLDRDSLFRPTRVPPPVGPGWWGCRGGRGKSPFVRPLNRPAADQSTQKTDSRNSLFRPSRVPPPVDPGWWGCNTPITIRNICIGVCCVGERFARRNSNSGISAAHRFSS